MPNKGCRAIMRPEDPPNARMAGAGVSAPPTRQRLQQFGLCNGPKAFRNRMILRKIPMLHRRKALPPKGRLLGMRPLAGTSSMTKGRKCCKCCFLRAEMW